MLNQNNPNVWKQENYKILYDVLLGLHIHDKNVKYVNSLKYVSMNVRENVRPLCQNYFTFSFSAKPQNLPAIYTSNIFILT